MSELSISGCGTPASRPANSRARRSRSPLELREPRKRNRLLEQEVEVLRRAAAYLSQAHLPGKALPARERARRGRDSYRGVVPGSEARSPALLPLVEGFRDRAGVGCGVSRERVARGT